MAPFRKFIRQFGHFLGGMVVSQIFSLITFPILTRVLTKEQYGILGLVTATMLFGVAVAKAGLSDGIIRFYKEYSGARENLAVFSSSVLIRGIVLSIITVLMYLGIFSIVNKRLGLSDEYYICFMIMAINLMIRPLNIIVLYFLRVNDKTLFINVLNIFERMISVGLSLFLLLYIFRDFYGYFIGVVMTELLVSIILFYWFFKNYSVKLEKVSRELTKKLIKFGAPLLLSELSFLIMSYADRYIIMAYLGEQALGVYSVGYNLAMYIGNIIMFSLSYSVIPIYVEIYSVEGREKTEDFLKKCMHYLLVVIIPMWFGYFAIDKDLLIALASEKYESAATFSPIILVGYFLLAMNTLFSAGLYLRKKTMALFGITVTGIILNITMNIILLPRLQLMGAAVSSLLSFLTAIILTRLISGRYISVHVEIKDIIYYLILSGIMFLIINEIKIERIWLALTAKIIVGILIILIGVLYREKEIINAIKQKYERKKSAREIEEIL